MSRDRPKHEGGAGIRRKGPPSAWARLRRFFWSWWPWALTGLVLNQTGHRGWALAAVFMAVLCYLLAPKAEPPRYGLEHRFSTDSDEFLPTMVGVTDVPFLAGNQLELLNNGDAFYPRMLKDIEQAQRSITIEAYIYWAGEVGLQFARALQARARAGITVKILLDSVGSSTIGKDILAILESECQVAWFNPIHWYTIGRFNNRTHRKSLIIDGAIGYTGGAGIADHWRGNAEGPGSWRDTQMRVAGPGVIPLQSGFAHNWLETTGELVTGDAFFPVIPPQGSVAVQTLLSSPETGGSNIRTMYYLSIVCASRSIFIANPYFVPDPVATESLIGAKRRGVDVRIMVSGVHNDNWLARRNSVRLYGPLLEAGIPILEFNRTMLHQKTMVIDGIWATAGTTNFDDRSFAHNEESNLCFLDRTLAAEFHQTFLADVDGCDSVTLELWRKRGLWARAQETVASFLQEQA